MRVEPPAAWTVGSPREAALRMLAARYPRGGDRPPTVPLAEFQRESFERATVILERRRGVVIADSVGLGKTYVALALIERALGQGHRMLVVVPAVLRARWRSELRRIQPRPDSDRLHLATHTRLGRGMRFPAVPFDLVVVDEAHAFRNPRTRRYAALRRLCRTARVVLITATPVNNSLSDLYFLLRLFCTDGAFRDLGIGSLGAALRHAARPDELERIRHAVVIRHTRADVRLARETGAAPCRLRFPRHVRLVTVPYDLPLPVDRLAALLGRLTFAAHGAGRPGLATDLLRFNLLKRCESGVPALRASLERLLRFNEEFESAWQDGLRLEPARFRDLYRLDSESLQLVLRPVVLDAATGADAPLAGVREDRRVLVEWLAALRATRDDKIERLGVLLAERSDRRTVVFSEYRDTAHALWSALRRRFRTGLITGNAAWLGDAPAARQQVVAAFAPAANGCPAVASSHAVEVLIATDVLAEGMNLQDADAVVSYDLPWNPVRLIQRAGRVDRLGSPHDVVEIHNFLPDREFDRLLGLADTLRTKLETVRTAIGTEGAVLEPGDDFTAVARSLAAGDAAVLDRIDGGSDAVLRAAVLDGPTPPDRGPVLAALPSASGRTIVLGVERGADWRVIRLDARTGEEIGGADAILAAAVGNQECEPVDVGAAGRAIAGCLTALRAREDALVLSAGAPEARLARAIRSRLTREGRDDASRFADADEVLDRLAASLDGISDSELEALLADEHPTLTDLLEGARRVLRGPAGAAARTRAWRVTGAIVAD